MDNFKSKYCSDWKVTGIVVGVVGAAFSMLCVMFFGGMFIFVAKSRDLLIVFSVLAINSAVSVTWLMGIFKKKPGLLLFGLFWWAVPLSLWIGIVFYNLFRGISDYFGHKSVDTRSYEMIIYLVAVLLLTFYFAAVMSHKNLKEEIRKNRSEIPRLDVSYAMAATECKELNVPIDDKLI